MPDIGDKAPDFKLDDQSGKTHSLNDYAGKWVVLYFYPKDNTPGCTKESCSFNDNLSSVSEKNAVVFGVSADSVASHEKFATKYGFGFPLLSDPEKEVIEAYGVWQEKNNYGKKSMGIVRTTYLIDPDGNIAQVWRKVKVDGHTEQVLAAIA
jgi:thioredoxin-dependent peroxiredoxin